jgi:hypothetical protein
MSEPDKTPDTLLRELSDRLGLNYEPQDWGIVNADGARLNEFIDFFVQSRLEPTQMFELADLILASANDCMIRGLELNLPILLGLAERHQSTFDPHIEYWSGLSSDEEFPLSRALRTALSP